jgi:hypothetical protein
VDGDGADAGAAAVAHRRRRTWIGVVPTTPTTWREGRAAYDCAREERLAEDAALGRNDARARHARLATNDADRTAIGARGV